MISKENFRKGIIENKIGSYTYEVRDLLDDSIKTLVLRGKIKLYLNEYNIKLGEEVYIMKYEMFQKDEWRVITSTEFKMDQELFGLKIDIDNMINK